MLKSRITLFSAFKIKIFLYLIPLLCISCSASKYIFNDTLLKNFKALKIADASSFEMSIGSENITGQSFTIGESIYPNKNKFLLENPMCFHNKEKPNFEVETNYFYTADGSVKVILYQWNDRQSNEHKIIKNYKIPVKELNIKSNRKAFQTKFDQLKNDLIKRLGPLSENDDDQNNSSESFRIGRKWNGVNGVNAYLFMSGNETGFSQIRLAIYGE